MMGHPKGLFYLFFAELWERFSFYGMRALLVLYMTKQLIFDDEFSFGVYAAYMSLVYVTPIIGGVVADNYLGYRKSIFLGGILMDFSRTIVPDQMISVALNPSESPNSNIAVMIFLIANPPF